MCGLGSRGSFTPTFLVSRRKYSRNLPLRSKFFDVPRKNLAGSGSSWIIRRIAKAAAVMAKLSKKVWTNSQLTMKTKLKVYQACVLSTLLYSSESWSMYARQENRLESFHLRCLRRVLGITWQDKVTNAAVLEQAGSLSMHLMLSQRRLRWLGHVHRMEDGRIPKDILFGELAMGRRPVGRPAPRFKDVCKRDLKLTDINTDSWESLAEDRSGLRQAVQAGVRKGEEKRNKQMEEKRTRRKQRRDSNPATPYICNNCGKDCHARIGLLSHSSRCSQHH